MGWKEYRKRDDNIWERKSVKDVSKMNLITSYFIRKQGQDFKISNQWSGRRFFSEALENTKLFYPV